MTSTTATAKSSFTASAPRHRALWALLRRDTLILASYRVALVLDVFLGVMDVIVYHFISETFEGATTASLGNAPSYFAFALVGIVVTVVIQAAAVGIATKIREEQLTGTLEALIAQPVRVPELAFGMCGLPILFSTVRVAIYLVFGALAFGLDLSHTSWIGFAAMLIATSVAMSAIGIGTAAVVLVIKRGNAIAGFAIFAMSLVGGAFFPVSVLPDWLEAIGKVVPPRFAFDGFRDALYEGSGWESDALVLLAFTVVTLPTAVWLFGRALDHTRRSGTLAQY
jgi:ABC-2 type transport system permease protein